MRFYKEYGWTESQVDEMELNKLARMIVVQDKLENAPVLANIEDVLP